MNMPTIWDTLVNAPGTLQATLPELLAQFDTRPVLGNANAYGMPNQPVGPTLEASLPDIANQYAGYLGGAKDAALGVGSWLNSTLGPGLETDPIGRAMAPPTQPPAINPAQDYGGGGIPHRNTQVAPYQNMNQVLDAISNIGANRAMAQPDPRDAHLFAEGADQAMQDTDRFLQAFRQQAITPHIQARFQPSIAGLNPAAADYQLGEPQRRRQAEQALTMAIEDAMRTGTYGTGGYGVRDNQIVTPAAMTDYRAQMSKPELQNQLAALQQMQLVNPGGVTVDEGATTRQMPDTQITLPRQTGKPANFRSGAGQAYVGMQQAAIDAMKAGVDPFKLQQNVLQGPAMDGTQRKAYEEGEAKRKSDMQARIATERAGSAKRRADNATIAKAQREGMNPLMRRLLETQGTDPNAQGSIMDMLYPEQAVERQKLAALQAIENNKLDVTKRGQDLEEKRLSGQQGIDQQKMQLAIQELANQQAAQQRQFDIALKELGIKADAARNAGPLAGLGSPDPDTQAWARESLGGGSQTPGGPPNASKTIRSMSAAQSPEEALGYLLANPSIVDNPELLQSTIQANTNTLSPAAIQGLLRQYDPEEWSYLNPFKYSPAYPENRGTARGLLHAIASSPVANLQRVFQEDPNESALRQKKIALLRRLRSFYTGQ